MAEEWPSPAYVIRTPRLVVRCYERGDVDGVHEAVRANVEALRPWMPWIENEPLSRADRAEQLRAFRGLFDAGRDFLYGIFDRADGRYLGGCGLHPRVGPGGLEIGYWIAEDRWGRGLASEAATALTRVGFDWMGAERMEIRVAPANARSLSIPRKLGYREEGRLRGIGPTGPDGRQDLLVFGRLAAEGVP
ncbi:MAG TPA: GNAT family N-acetyltransferase [Sandaracinaceae bacterium LLY-WYZ-13_1]|nr:GNAT family N-acetyltransferase [Sandaracinaceae bacterium LLY-WYZ-13_1]